MKRKISILTLTLLFFISTTALPLSMHLCKMSQDEDVCEHIMVKKTSCCEEETESQVNYTSAMEQCCSDQVIDKTVKDNFISSKSDKNNFTSLKFLPVVILSIEFISYSLNSSFIDKDKSPPDLQSNDLYLNNSVLLI